MEQNTANHLMSILTNKHQTILCRATQFVKENFDEFVEQFYPMNAFDRDEKREIELCWNQLMDVLYSPQTKTQKIT